MIIAIKDLERDSVSLHGEESTVGLDLDPAALTIAGNLEYELEVGISEGGLWVYGKLRLPVSLFCVSCLEQFATAIEVPDFAVQIELQGKEVIDLTEWIREDILINLPPYPKCDSDGKKACPASFQSVEHVPAETQLSENCSTWSVLDAIEISNLKK